MFITVDKYIAAWYVHVVGTLEHLQERTFVRGGCGDWRQRQWTAMMRMMKEKHWTTRRIHAFISIHLLYITSNQIYLPAQNIKEKQLKNIRLTHTKINDIQSMSASRTQRQRDCSYMSPKE